MPLWIDRLQWLIEGSDCKLRRFSTSYKQEKRVYLCNCQVDQSK